MDDSTLLKLALSFSVIGIIALYFFSEVIELEELPIENIDMNMIGDEIKIKGIVSNVRDFEKILIIDIKDMKTNNIIPVLLFKDGNIEIKSNSEVSVIGEVQEYNGKVELIGEEVKVFNQQSDSLNILKG